MSNVFHKSYPPCGEDLEQSTAHLHNTRWKIWLITLVGFGAVPPIFLPSLALLFQRFGSQFQWSGIADGTKWNLLALDIVLNFRTGDTSATIDAGSCGEWTMALEDAGYARQCFKCVYVLGIILERLSRDSVSWMMIGLQIVSNTHA